jgi:hypothetical protein
MNGSGKTYLAQTYLQNNNKQVLVLDTKGTYVIKDIQKQITIETINQLRQAARHYKFIIYRPKREELTQEYYNAFFEFCYNLKDCTVDVDEIMQIAPSPNIYPEFFKGILTRGRELNVNLWGCTQRPATIPVVSYSEAVHWFIFKMNALCDRKRLADFTGYDSFLQQIPKYYFWYYSTDTTEAPIKGILRG